jgi:hypothetical protein
MRFFMLLSMCLLICSFVRAEDKVVYNYSNWVQVKNEDLKVSFKLPAKHKLLERKDNAIQSYLIAENLDQEDSSTKTLTIESKVLPGNFKQTCEMVLKAIKGGEGSKKYIRDEAGKLAGLPALVVTYHFKENGYENTSEMSIVDFKGRYYALTFTSRSMIFMNDKPLKNQIFATINFEAMQTSKAFELKKPDNWFEFKDNEYSIAYAKKDNGGKSPSDGIIRAKIVKLDQDLSLSQFAAESLGELVKSGKTSDGIAKIPSLNGQALCWFDVVSEDKLFKERYHFAKDGYTFYVIYFISSNDAFEKDLKKVLADCLLTFKLKDNK